MVLNGLPEPTKYLKTPTANLGRNGAPQHPDKRKAGGHGPTLEDEVAFLVPEPEGEAQDWADFTPAVRRQEAILGRPAPIPTEKGPRGGRRLTARFTEWLMGLPDGWITGVDLSPLFADVKRLSARQSKIRAAQIKASGNGVVPDQAEAAFRYLLGTMEAPNA